MKPKPKFAYEEQVIGKWRIIDEKPVFGKSRVNVECVCGGRRWLYVWSWAGHGWAKCHKCGCRLHYLSGKVIKRFVAVYREGSGVAYQGVTARVLHPPYLLDDVWHYDIETSDNRLIAAVREHELSKPVNKPSISPQQRKREKRDNLPPVIAVGDNGLLVSEPLASGGAPFSLIDVDSVPTSLIPPKSKQSSHDLFVISSYDPNKNPLEVNSQAIKVLRRAKRYYDDHMDYLVNHYDPSKHKFSPSMQYRFAEAAAADYILTGRQTERHDVERWVLEIQEAQRNENQ